MEWLAQLQGQVVGLDSAPLIYFIEENQTYLEMTDAFISGGASFFLTNDARLPSFPGLEVLVLEELRA